MRNPGGVGVITDPNVAAPYQECDTFTCGHCQYVVFVPVRQNPEDIGGLCKQCMVLICPKCVDRMVCVTWEQMIAMQEAHGRTFRSIEETLGHALNEPSLL